MLQATNLQVNHLKNPTGIIERPMFSWILNSDSQNVKQKTYQLQIAEDSSFSDMVFDSQLIRDDSSINVVADRFSFVSATKYFWRVKISDNQEEKSAWSDIAHFITGILDVNEWQGDFITAETLEDKENSKGTLLRGQFAVNGEVQSAYLFCTALGVYKPFLNGARIGENELSPGWTAYDKRLLYQTYEVGSLLNQGENVIGAMIGVGWYKGRMGFIVTRNNYGDRTAFYAMLMIRYRDGRKQLFSSDQSWLGADAPVVFSEIYDGEIYDARLELDGWCEPGQPEGNWKRAATVEFEKTKLCAQEGCPVKQMEEIPVKQVIITPKGETVLDFGQNLSGWLRFSVQGETGDRVEMNFFETLDSDGNAYFDNLRTAKQTIIYDCKDSKRTKYHPNFTFQGFQYVRVVSYPGEMKPEYFTAVVIHSDMQATGTFACSNADINQLHHNILWGMKGNFVDLPTDCPQRDERLGWTGDAQIFCQTASYLMDSYAFFRKWLKDLAADQTEDGGVAHVVPDLLTRQKPDEGFISQGTHSAAGWADAAVIIPWTQYLTYGDQTVLEEQYESMRAWIDFMTAHVRDGIWNYGLQFGDWLALDAEEGSYFGATPIELTNTAYYAYSTKLFVKAAGVLKKQDDIAKYQTLYDGIVKTFRDAFMNADGTMKVQTQTAHILALHFHLVPPEFTNQAVQGLLALLRRKNGHLATGFMGTSYFCQTLSEYGCVKEAYDLLLKNDFPSWLYQVSMGATTIWEHWDGKKPDGSMWSADMNSFNHYAYGAVGEWFYRTMAGIETSEAAPGFRRSIIYPRFDNRLQSCNADLKTVFGLIGVAWTMEDRIVQMTVRVPHNTTACIRLDQAKFLDEASGLTFVPKGGCLEAEAGSGTYMIRFIRN